MPSAPGSNTSTPRPSIPGLLSIASLWLLITICRRRLVLRWMCWEQYNHEPNVATMRFWKSFLGLEKLNDGQRAQLETKWMAGEAALCLMEKHLEVHDWFVGERLTLADICLYAYTHVAQEGGFTLSRYPAIVRWLARVATQPGHVTIGA